MPAPIPVPDRPEAFNVPTRRFWGERKPPKNRAEMFSKVRNASEEAGGDSTASTAASGGVATLRMYGPIDSWGGWWGISARDVSEALDSLGQDISEVRVRINSPGGEVWEALAILNMLRAHPAKVVAVVDGIAASAASVIAAGCDETVMSPGTQMMIHDASGFAYGPAAIMRKAASFLDSTSNAIASLYAEAAGGTDATWRAAMVDETWYTAQEAVDAGLADRVEVVPDAGATSTAGEDESQLEDDVQDRFDLSIFNYAGRTNAPAPKPPSASAVGSTPTQEGSPAVAFSDEQVTTMRQKLGIAEDADETTIMAALDEALEERSDPSAANTATGQVPEGMALVDSEVLAELRSGAEAGRTARLELDTQARDGAIDAAVRAGKTTVARRAHWVTSWTADPEGTKALLDSLEPGLAVPTSELGHGSEPETTADDELYAMVFGDQKKGA
jgi:ATP-dependent protease ClpP protease subunit